MALRALGICVFACVLMVSQPSRGAVVEDPDAQSPCEEETVYGTVVVIDEDLGLFGLLGTRYRFQSMEELDLGFLQGRMVKIDIGADCGILGIRVLDGDSELIT